MIISNINSQKLFDQYNLYSMYQLNFYPILAETDLIGCVRIKSLFWLAWIVEKD